jgi:hypothetical protein
MIVLIKVIVDMLKLIIDMDYLAGEKVTLSRILRVLGVKCPLGLMELVYGNLFVLGGINFLGC